MINIREIIDDYVSQGYCHNAAVQKARKEYEERVEIFNSNSKKQGVKRAKARNNSHGLPAYLHRTRHL